VAGTSGWKLPPAGVPTEPDRTRAYVPLSTAAQRIGVDRRTLLAAVKRGDTGGWARPGPGHLRWYVYEDSLFSGRVEATDDRIAQLEVENERLRAHLAGLRTPGANDSDQSAETMIADLRARIVTLEESNLLLLGAQADLAAAADKYRLALSLHMTPGHIGDLSG
jgi:hypothetical protein